MQKIATLYIRIAAGTGFFLLGLGAWGPYGRSWVSWGDWHHFSAYAHQVMNFLPYNLAEILAVIATIVEITGGALLIIGLLTRWAAYACSALTLCFAIAMAISGGIMSPIGYSVFTVSAACLLLTVQPTYPYSLDALISTRAASSSQLRTKTPERAVGS